MELILQETAAAILGLDPDYSTHEEIETARATQLADASAGDASAADMINRAAALLLGVLGPATAADGALDIEDGLSIGPFSLACNIPQLKKLGITAVLSVDAARPPLFELEMADVSFTRAPRVYT